MKKRFLVLTMAFTMFASQFGSPIMAMARENVVARRYYSSRESWTLYFIEIEANNRE